MPGGQASHKGTSDKPNTNAPGIVGDAADKSVNPEAVIDEPEAYPYETDRQDNAAATQRPKE